MKALIIDKSLPGEKDLGDLYTNMYTVDIPIEVVKVNCMCVFNNVISVRSDCGYKTRCFPA